MPENYPKPPVAKKFTHDPNQGAVLKQGLQLIAQRNIVQQCFEFHGVIHSHDGGYIEAQPLVWSATPLAEGSKIGQPFMTLGYKECQMIFDELYAAGLRPQGKNESGEIKRMEAHLADLKEILVATMDLKK